MIVGKHSRSAIGTPLDRTSRAVRLIHLPYGHGSLAFTDAFGEMLAALPEAAGRTLTRDQGSGMARHDVLAEHFIEGVFFAEPGSPWQRGTNDNTNGLLRQFFPKGKDLSIYTSEGLARAEKLLNSRPRKILGWRTPGSVFEHGLRSPWSPVTCSATRPASPSCDLLIPSVCCEARTNSPLNSPVDTGSLFRRRRQASRRNPSSPKMKRTETVLTQSARTTGVL